MLNLISSKLFAGAGQLDEVDLEGSRWHIGDLIGEALEFGAIGDNLQAFAVELVEELSYLLGLCYPLGHLRGADDSGCGSR